MKRLGQWLVVILAFSALNSCAPGAPLVPTDMRQTAPATLAPVTPSPSLLAISQPAPTDIPTPTATATLKPTASNTPLPTFTATSAPSATATPRPTSTRAPATATVSSPAAQTSPTRTPIGQISISGTAGLIALQVPAKWQGDACPWEGKWTIAGKSYPFTAQHLSASPDLAAYNSGWETKGIFLATSADWAVIDSYAGMLEGARIYYTGCTAGTLQSFANDRLEGQLIVYTRCEETSGNVRVIAARPVGKPAAPPIFIEMRYVTQAEVDELNAILNTLVIQP